MDYEYKDQQFSVEIAEALIPERNGTYVSLKFVENRVLTAHMERGGLEHPVGEDSRVMVKQALRNLSSIAKASEISKNRWRYVKPDQWIFGTGKHWIYLYYFPQEKRDAAEKGRSVFPCKIGKTDGVNRKGNIKHEAPETRVKSLTSGAREFAKNPLLLRTDTHRPLETAIHKNLELQGKRIHDRPSQEWFLTNPSEVVEIVYDIKPGLLSPVTSHSALMFIVNGG